MANTHFLPDFRWWTWMWLFCWNLLKFVTHVYFYFRTTVKFLYEEPLWIIISLYISFLILKANQKGLFVENNVSGKALFCVQEGLKKTAGKKYISTRKISNADQHSYYKSKLVWMKCYNSYVLTCFISTGNYCIWCTFEHRTSIFSVSTR